jgi:large subunit ribosomal protein L19e
MSVKLTRRIAAEVMGKGVSKVRIKTDAIKGAEAAITREDVRALVSNGSIYAVKAKHNVSTYSKLLAAKRTKGRGRGHGRRKGTRKARQGLQYQKKIRGQRRVLHALKGEIDSETFKKYYRLVRGGNFATKASLLNHMVAEGVKMDQERFEKLRHL